MHGLAPPDMGLKPSRKRTKAGRYARDVSYAELQSQFHLPTKVACKKLGVGLTVFKRICRRFGLQRWPYKKASQWNQDTSEDLRRCSPTKSMPPFLLHSLHPEQPPSPDAGCVLRPCALHTASSPLAAPDSPDASTLSKPSGLSGQAAPPAATSPLALPTPTSCRLAVQQAGEESPCAQAATSMPSPCIHRAASMAGEPAAAPQQAPGMQSSDRNAGDGKFTMLLTAAAGEHSDVGTGSPATDSKQWVTSTTVALLQAAQRQHAASLTATLAALPVPQGAGASGGFIRRVHTAPALVLSELPHHPAAFVGGTPTSAFQPFCATAGHAAREAPPPPAHMARSHTHPQLHKRHRLSAPSHHDTQRTFSLPLVPSHHNWAASPTQQAAILHNPLPPTPLACGAGPTEPPIWAPASPRPHGPAPTQRPSSLKRQLECQQQASVCAAAAHLQVPQHLPAHDDASSHSAKAQLLQAFAAGLRAAQEMREERTRQAQLAWLRLLHQRAEKRLLQLLCQEGGVDAETLGHTWESSTEG